MRIISENQANRQEEMIRTLKENVRDLKEIIRNTNEDMKDLLSEILEVAQINDYGNSNVKIAKIIELVHDYQSNN